MVSIGGQNDSTASNSVLLPLNRRDRVWIQLRRGKLVEPYSNYRQSNFVGPKVSGYTSLVGYLIGEISHEGIDDSGGSGNGFLDNGNYDEMYDDGNNQVIQNYPDSYYPTGSDNNRPTISTPITNDNQIIIDTQRIPPYANKVLR